MTWRRSARYCLDPAFALRLRRGEYRRVVQCRLGDLGDGLAVYQPFARFGMADQARRARREAVGARQSDGEHVTGECLGKIDIGPEDIEAGTQRPDQQVLAARVLASAREVDESPVATHDGAHHAARAQIIVEAGVAQPDFRAATDLGVHNRSKEIAIGADQPSSHLENEPAVPARGITAKSVEYRVDRGAKPIEWSSLSSEK